MLADRAEIVPEPDVVVEADLLVAEEDRLVLDERPVQFLELVVRQRLGQVEGAAAGADLAKTAGDRGSDNIKCQETAAAGSKRRTRLPPLAQRADLLLAQG
jgi:hypothetical protein